MSKISENILEETCLYWLEELGWNISPIGITLTPNPSPRGRGKYALDKDGTGLAQFERNAYSEVILVNRLRESLIAINPDVPAVGIDEAVRKILTTDSPDLLTNNRNFHRMLTDGIDVEIPAGLFAHPPGITALLNGWGLACRIRFPSKIERSGKSCFPS